MDSIRIKTLEGILTEEEISSFEMSHSEGISSADIVEFFANRGLRLSEATFRKYVQLGLLPRSRRIGSKGKHKGSKGVYPVGAVRQINEIKRMMALDYTIEEIREHFVFVGGEVEELRELFLRVFERLQESLLEIDDSGIPATSVRRLISEARRDALNLIERIEDAAKKLREIKQVEREAI